MTRASIYESTLAKSAVPQGLYAKRRRMLDAVLGVILALQDVWPLTVRQVHYRCLGGAVPGYVNDRKSYETLSDILSFARLRGELPWHAIEDRSRSTMESGGFADMETFIEEEIADFLAGYRRDLLQTQAVRPVILTEKDTIAPILHKSAFEYCVPVIVCRGQVSWSYKRGLAERAWRHSPQRTAFLHFGDCDPEGVHIPLRAVADLAGELGLDEDEFSLEHVAVVRDQALTEGLPPAGRVKRGSSLGAEYIGHFGDDRCWEVDALHPRELHQRVKDAIEGNLDMGKFRVQKRIQTRERQQLAERRAKVLGLLRGAS